MSDAPQQGAFGGPGLYGGRSSLLYAWLVTFLIWVACVGIASMLAESAGSYFGNATTVRFALTALPFLLVWFCGPFVARRVAGPVDRELGLATDAGQSFLRGLLWYVPLGLVWLLAQFVYDLVLKLLDLELPAQRAVLEFTGSSDWLLLASIIVSAVVCAPLGEEMVFRGLLHGGLRRFLGFWQSAVIGSVFFGLLHVENANGFLVAPPLALLGLMLCWIRRRHGLWAAVSFHAAHNAVALVLVSILGP